jgi:hypothetical protein
MPTRLLIVEEAFTTSGRGVMVSPKITLANVTREPFTVRLRLPSGDEREATAVFEIPHIRGPLPPFAMIRIHGLTPGDVPPGTEIWRQD